MKHLALLALIFSLPVAAIELDGDKVVLTPQERLRMSQCVEQGGCFIVTRAQLDAVVDKVMRVTVDAVCKKGIAI